jgi:flagellar basal-body rod modification protein FlgD
MTIDSINNYLGSSNLVEQTSNYQSSTEKTLGRDQFLTLLVAQLQNQDPLNPLESQDFTAQMAQFSSLEQLFDVNESLMNIQAGMQSSQKESALDYVGMEVKAAGNTLYKNGENMDQASYYLETSGEVVVSIFDSNGVEVRQIQADFQESGEHDLVWDGRDANGNLMQDGIYTYGVSAIDADGYDVYTTTYSRGEVTGVSSQYGQTYLIVGDRLLEPDSVLEALQIEEN